MARTRQNMVFVVTSHVPEDDTVHGIAFPNAQKAQKFATAVTKAARRIAAKTLGLDKDETKKFTKTLPLDILMQPLDANNEPVGNPAYYGSEGLEGFVEDDEDGDEDSEATADED